MNIVITARHFDISESLKSRIEEKLLKLQKFSSNLMEASIIIEMVDRRSLVELNLHSRTSDFYATAKSYEMHMAVDNAIKKMKKQLRSHRDRLKEHKQKG
jgi:putative sigma-54 modulation protein